MTKFKVGDKVVRLASENTDKFIGLLGHKTYYIVTGLSEQGYRVQVDGVTWRGYRYPWNWANFELYVEPEEGLSPAPESVVYFNSVRDKGNDQCLELSIDCATADFNPEAAGNLGLCIIPCTGSRRAA